MTDKKEYKKVTFLDNVPITVTFNYDHPKSGEHDGKKWYLYSVTENGEQKSFFADEKLHPTLVIAKVKKGVTTTITHKQRPSDKKQKFWEVVVDGTVYTSDDTDSARTFAEVEKEEKKRAYKPDIDRLVGIIAVAMLKINQNGELADLSEESKVKIALSVCISLDRHGIDPPETVQEALEGEEVDSETPLPF